MKAKLRATLSSPRWPTIVFLCIWFATFHTSTSSRSSTPAPFFNDVTSSIGISIGCDCDFGDCGSGVAFTDYDADGDLDLFVAMDCGVNNRLFDNDGAGNFTNRAGAAGVNHSGCGKAVKCADYDNDGYPDVFVANWDGPNKLYHNNQDGTFSDVTGPAGLNFTGKSSGAAWGDFNNDGNLDLYVAVWEGSNLFYVNRGTGRFDERATQLGIENAGGLSFECAWFDYDNDNDLDLYVVNDFASRNAMYRNNGDGTFEDVSLSSGTGLSMLAMGIAIADYDHNGYLDLYITNAPVGNALLRNNGDGTFTDVAKSQHVLVNRNGWGTAFFDYDNDGDDDLYVVDQTEAGGTVDSENMLFRNDSGTFTDVSAASGLADQRPGFAMAVGDYNNDGYFDVFVHNCSRSGPPSPSSLYENTMSGNNWIKIKTIGTQSNRDGIGARIRVLTGAVAQIKEVSGGSSYLSHNSLEVGFGLGSFASIDVLEVRWPSGIVDVYQDVPVNRTQMVTEGETVPVFITGFAAGREDDRVDLSWTIASDEAISGFRVYRGGPRSGGIVELARLGPTARGYVDDTTEGGGSYRYLLAVVLPDGSELRSQTIDVAIPARPLTLQQNYPNPFNPATRIRFSVPGGDPVELAVFDAAGHRVATLVDRDMDGGAHEAAWNGLDARGRPVATGVYFYRLKTGGRTLTRKMILVR